ncbi:hypothetical protein CYMTET_39409 [Cymbomonas tetramitiformis]|uniref:Uncharacterized protein n=1 Tax=Cymbomonas tetramitiformis TaxID=36881 RepID=A0AAE0CA51_9CHLO|nr:hypothetical protein CYMTET_39409 [Cymbomonas tetramitiformis]
MATAFEQCPPLSLPRSVFQEKDYRVPLRIGEKLWGGPDLAKLLALCAYTGVLAERSRTVVFSLTAPVFKVPYAQHFSDRPLRSIFFLCSLGCVRLY